MTQTPRKTKVKLRRVPHVSISFSVRVKAQPGNSTYKNSLAQDCRWVKAVGLWTSWSHDTHRKRREHKWMHVCQSGTGSLLSFSVGPNPWHPSFLEALLILVCRTRKTPSRQASRPPIPDRASFLSQVIPTVLTETTDTPALLPLIPPSRHWWAIFVYSSLAKA